MEFVYVVKRSDLFDLRTPHGLEVLEPAAMEQFRARVRRRGFFVELRHAERDASLKQVIPYCVVMRRGRVFVMRRLAGGGESRLHGKRTVGVGGHVNPIDGSVSARTGEGAGEVVERDVVAEALRREIDEELHIDGPWDVRPVGLLNDDSTDVGSVHVGLVNVVTTSADVRVRETDVLSGRFVDRGALRELLATERDTFETWSALVLDRMDDVLAP